MTVTNNGLLSANAGVGIDVTTNNGIATITNSGVTSLNGTANQVNVDQSTGAIVLSLPQDIHTNAVPVFDGLTLDNINNASGANQIVVSNNGAVSLVLWLHSSRAACFLSALRLTTHYAGMEQVGWRTVA